MNPVTPVTRKTYIRAVCASSMKAGNNATAAVRARFQRGARKRRPATQVRTMSNTPQIAEGSRNAHSLGPKTCAAPAIR